MKQLLGSLSAERALPLVVGLALCHSWILSPFLSGTLYYVCFHTGFAAALFVCAAVYRTRPDGTPMFRMMPWIAAAAMTASTIGASAAGADSAHVMQIVAGAAGGAGSAYCFARWFMSFSSLTMKTAVGSTLLAFALSGCVRLCLVCLQGVSQVALDVILSCLPLASVVLLVRASNPAPGTVYSDPLGRSVDRRQHNVRSADTTSSTVPAPGYAGILGRRPPTESSGVGGDIPAITLEVVAYGLVFGLIREGISEWSAATSSMMIGHVLRIVIPLLMFWWLSIRTKGGPQTPALRLAVLMVAFVTLAVLFFGGLGGAVLGAIVLAARSLVSILIYIRALEAMHRAKLHPMIAYGAGRGCYEVALVAGLLAYRAAAGAGLDGMLSFDAYYFFVCCVLLLLLNGFSSAMRLPFLQSVPTSASSAFDDACTVIASTYALTERETEVMRLICKGNTKRRIAEMLFVSEDTIRYHSKNLYQKLDVHSRQELLDLVSGE